MFYQNYVKRFVDFLFSLLALTVLFPFLLIVTILLTICNKGAGAFFFQKRPGLNEKIFSIIKFKTMTDEKDNEGILLPDEKRITKVGKFVRSMSIDELPQLINVLKGDMSFIGPRPLLVKYLPYYTKEESLRHTVRPGISGWAQVNGRNSICWDQKLAYDVEYVKNLSLWMDIKVLMKTVQNVLSRKDVVLQAIPDLDEERKNK